MKERKKMERRIKNKRGIRIENNKIRIKGE
jgi:hypothetical protein